jgi:hypothetical protein
MHRKKINISTVMAGQRLGIKEVDDGIWLISFMHYDPGYIDLEQKTLQTIDNPLETNVLPMSQLQTVTYVSGSDTVFIFKGKWRTLEERVRTPYSTFSPNGMRC